ncbi:MAG: dihydrofolate reductase family protein [Caldilineaceae bacterium]
MTHAHLFAALRCAAADHHQRTGRPLVTLSYAQSLDGSITAQPGQPFAISSAESLQWTHSLRAAHDAILVGIGAVLADDPSLTVRFAQGQNPQPVVVDSHLRLPTDAQLLRKHDTIWLPAATHARTAPAAQSRPDPRTAHHRARTGRSRRPFRRTGPPRRTKRHGRRRRRSSPASGSRSWPTSPSSPSPRFCWAGCIRCARHSTAPTATDYTSPPAPPADLPRR